MSNLLNKFINNEIDTEPYEKFVVIIGENPSKNARSPILWNAAFKKKKLKYFMFPVDVSKNRLIDVLNLLDQELDESKFNESTANISFNKKNLNELQSQQAHKAEALYKEAKTAADKINKAT